MAQENSPDKEKRQSRTKKPEKPYVEQIDELLLIHNKNDPKEGLGVVSKADEKGNYQTVTPEEKNENSFLKFDKNSSILENLIKNFWSQFKEPTHFRLLRMTFHDYKVNKQAIKDLAEGKKTDAVKEFLKRYEIRPRENKEEQNMNKQETAMAKKETHLPYKGRCVVCLSDIIFLSIFRQSLIRRKPTCSKKLRERIRRRMPS